MRSIPATSSDYPIDTDKQRPYINLLVFDLSKKEVEKKKRFLFG